MLHSHAMRTALRVRLWCRPGRCRHFAQGKMGRRACGSGGQPGGLRRSGKSRISFPTPLPKALPCSLSRAALVAPYCAILLIARAVPFHPTQ